MFISAQCAFEKADKCFEKKRPFFFAFDYELKNAIFLEEKDFENPRVKFKVGKFSNYAPRACHLKFPQIRPIPISFKSYQKKFDAVKESIMRGDSFLANLTIKTPIFSEASLREIFESAQAKYILFVSGKFLSFSPETFVKTNDGKIFSNPMKGTASLSEKNSAKNLENSEKEIREHNTIVDLIRNDLNFAATDVRLNKFRYAEEIKRLGAPNLLQTSSEICGNICKKKFSEIIKPMLPAGSISGAPKTKTVEILKKAEGENRNFYTGIFGMFDGENLDSAVAIRFIEQEKGKLFFRSGGGITSQSSAKSEYEEAIEKIYIPCEKNVFLETIKLKDGEIFNLEAHRKRFQKTLAKFYPESGLEFPNLQKLSDENPCGLFKIRVLYSDKIEKIEVLPYSPQKISSLKIVNLKGAKYSHKSANRAPLDFALSQKGAASDVIICKNGKVCDSSYANIAFKKNGKLYTPKTFLLNGTKRQKLIKDGILEVRDISIPDIKNYERAVFINSMLDPHDDVGANVENIIFD